MSHASTKGYSVPVVADWRIVARDVAAMLKPGDILALQGPLGAGKTTFVQALTQAMGSIRTPKSPTFSMLRTYAVRQGKIRRVLHVDAYRIEHERDLVPLDLNEELAAGDAVLLLEWPENVKKWLKTRKVKTLRISIKGDCREAVMM